jgi:hypothetical protein
MIITFSSLVGLCELPNDEASWTGMAVGIGIAGTATRGIGCSGMDTDRGRPPRLPDPLFGFDFLVTM